MKHHDKPLKRRRIVYAPVTFSEERGVRYLHFGTEWIQGAMRIRKPDAIELEYAQQLMAWTLFVDAPSSIVQLGLGAAAVTKACRRDYPDAVTTAVELNPAVVVAARTMFDLPPDDAHLRMVEADADDYVRDPDHHGSIDAMQVDLYDARAAGPVLESLDFYTACRDCLRAPGVLTVNLFGAHASFGRNMKNLSAAFEGRVVALPEVHEGNRIAIGFRGPAIDVPWTVLRERAAIVARRTQLPASRWVDALRESMLARRGDRGGSATRFRL